MMPDSYMNSMCLESWGRSNYARILIENNACNNFSDHLVMAISNLEGSGYMKETIRAYVGNEGDKKYKEVQGARNVSCPMWDFLEKVYMEKIYIEKAYGSEG
nr:hypothetical protein [Tanacetum cinerariifolium]